MRWNTTILLLSVFLCAIPIGCGTIPSYEDLGNGYLEATYVRTSWEQPAMRIELRYKKGISTVTIWPSLDGIRPILRDDIVVFGGMKAHEPPYPDEPRATMPRLFAVRAPELPLDITDEVLWRWSKGSGKDSTKVIKSGSISYLEEQNGKLNIHFVFWTTDNWPDIAITLDQNQISDIMREVKEKGVERKDPVWGTSYIEKEFKPETQK